MADLRQRRVAGSEATDASRPLPPPILPSVHSLQRLETLSNLLSPSTPAYAFDAPPTLLFFIATLLLLLPVRLLAALTIPVQDCDETFNYWEPVHYLLHGSALQTWEYSPVYALRSYSYVLLHAVAIKLCDAAGLSLVLAQWRGGEELLKLGQWYALRCMLALVCALCESALVWAVAVRFRRSVAVMTALLLACSAGMFHASVALVPSSFAMYCFMLSWACWLLGRYLTAILCTAVAALIGWPFCGLLALPLGCDILLRYRRQLHLPIIASFVSAALCIVPSLLIDHHYYRRWLLAVLNIALYNSTTSDGGSYLYGVAPASYYLLNLLLNHNLMLPLLLLSPAVALLLFALWRSDVHLLFLLWTSPLWLWLLAMLSMPHKEERFLFVVYPLIAFAAAYAAVHTTLLLRQAVCSSGRKPRPARPDDSEDESLLPQELRAAVGMAAKLGHGSRLVLAAAVAAVAVVSASRVCALIFYYDAPLLAYEEVGKRVLGLSSNPFSTAGVQEAGSGSNPFVSQSVCVGKEWYRFPSHFFLPSSASGGSLQLQFLPSSFTGLLPRHFHPSPSANQSLSFPFSLLPLWRDRTLGSSVIPPHQNDANRQETERFVPLHSCSFIVDLKLAGQQEPGYVGRTDAQHEWRVVWRRPFLDAERSARWSRSFWLPGIGNRGNHWGEYQLLERTDRKR